jgi:hypothetical protein
MAAVGLQHRNENLLKELRDFYCLIDKSKVKNRGSTCNHTEINVFGL